MEIEDRTFNKDYKEDNVAEALQDISERAKVVIPDRLFCIMSNGVEIVTSVCVSDEELTDMLFSFLKRFPQFIKSVNIAVIAAKSTTKKQ